MQYLKAFSYTLLYVHYKMANELSNNQGILYSKEHLSDTLRTIYESLDSKDAQILKMGY